MLLKLYLQLFLRVSLMLIGQDTNIKEVTEGCIKDYGLIHITVGKNQIGHWHKAYRYYSWEIFFKR